MKNEKSNLKAKVQRNDTPPPSTQTQFKTLEFEEVTRGYIYKTSPESETYFLITGIVHIPFTGWFVNSRKSYIGLMDGMEVIGSLRIGMDNLAIFVDGAPEAFIALPTSLER